MYQIEIANEQDCLALEEDFLIQIAERVLAEEQVAFAEISIALVDNAAIHDLNRRYLEHDYATDVLSFLLECEETEPLEDDSPKADGPPLPRGRGKRVEGEVIISTEMALQMAEDFGWSSREETVLYLIHGLLHLLGYDDLTSTERSVMRARERAMLGLWNVTPPNHVNSDTNTTTSGEGDSNASSSSSPDDKSDEDQRPKRRSLPQQRRTES